MSVRKLASTFVRAGTYRIVDVKDSDKTYAIRVEKDGNISLYECDSFKSNKWVAIHNSYITSSHQPIKEDQS